MMLNGANYGYLVKGCTDGFDYCTMVNSIICPVYNATNCFCQTCSTDKCNKENIDHYTHSIENTKVYDGDLEVNDIKTVLDSKSNNVNYNCLLNIIIVFIVFSFFY